MSTYSARVERIIFALCYYYFSAKVDRIILAESTANSLVE